MWAMNDASQEDVITCLEKLEYFCGTGIIETYNETRCAVVQDGWEWHQDHILKHCETKSVNLEIEAYLGRKEYVL